MRILGFILLVLFALGAPFFAIPWISEACYESGVLSPAMADRLTSATLLIGASGLLLCGKGIHWTLLRFRPWIAGIITILLWAPMTLLAGTYFYALLVFRSWA